MAEQRRGLLEPIGGELGAPLLDESIDALFQLVQGAIIVENEIGDAGERVARKKDGKEVPFLDLDERKERLKFHPDFKEEGRRELQVGPSKGYAIAHEIADVLEATSRVAPEKVDLSKPAYETDVLIIGAGGAGSRGCPASAAV